MTRPRGSTAADVTKGLGALAAVAALVAGVPAGLWAAVGWPLPRDVPAWSDIARALADTYVPDEFLVNTLAVVCWLAWAQLIAALAVEAVAAIRGRPAIRVPLAGPLQTTAAHLVAAVLLLAALTGPRVAAAAPPPLPTVELVAADPAAALPAPPPAVTPVIPDSVETPAPEPAPLPTYTVQRFDDLWSIAERHLADPYRWTDIWDLNRGRAFDGTTFRDPDLIHPGWTLDLPADATGLARPPAPQAPSPPAQQPRPAPSHDAAQSSPADVGDQDTAVHPDGEAHADAGTVVEPASPSTTPGAAPTRTPGPRPADTHGEDDTPVPAPTPQPLADPTPAEPTIHGDEQPLSPVVIELSSGAVVGLSFAAGVATCLTASRLHQRRRRQPADPAPGVRHTEPLATEPVRRLRRAHLTATQKPARPIDDPSAEDGPVANAAEQAPAAAPGPLAADHRHGQLATVNLIALGSVAVGGSTTEDTVRAALVDFLAAAPAGRAHALVTRASAERLLPDVMPFPGFEIVDGLHDALTRLEIELIHRTRVVDAADAADFTTLTQRHPEEPVARLLVITDAPDPALQPRLTAVLGLGRRLGITALVLGRQPDLPTITTTANGSVETVDPADALGELAQQRLPTVDSATAAQLLAVVAAGRGADTGQIDPEAEIESFPVQPSEPAPPIAVTLLGSPRIEAAGEEISTGLRSKARELLAFFLLHPHGATLETVVDALWPDADPQRGVERFRTVLGNLRSTLRAATGLDDAALVDRVGERYQADAVLIDCDLWRFQAALATATTAPDAAAVSAALQQATAAYGGDLAAGTYYEWAEAPREDLRRRAVDAAARLAELHEQAGDLDAALAALDTAIRHDFYTEELYRRTMRLQASLGRPDAARRTYRLLETRLTDLDVDPDDTTAELLHELLDGERASKVDKEQAVTEQETAVTRLA